MASERKGIPKSRSSPLVVSLSLAGSLFLFLAIRSNSLFLGLIGLGFFFFASLSYLITPRWFFRGELIFSLTNSSLSLLSRLMGPGGYRGKGFYIPLEEDIVAFIPKEETLLYLPKESVGGRTFLRNPEGIVLSAPGGELLKTIENLTGESFDESELHYSLSLISSAFTELEISRSFEFLVEGERVFVRMEDVIGRGFCKEMSFNFPEICERIGCPFCSAIACAISKSLKKPVIIDSVDLSPDGRVTEVIFRVLG
ncbi:MAG: hypothetical protein DRO05_07660 [Thermoproteota archaeon]|nr:MAG: hypothetical protein DRO05_07660 [Candidatus Korarchaeota archaeon]